MLEAGATLAVGAPTWALDMRGLVVGDLLAGSSILRHGLGADQSGETGAGREGWQTHDEQVQVVTCAGRVGLVSFSDTAVLDGVDLIGSERTTVARLLGEPAGHDAESVLFRQGPWELEIGFDAGDRVDWVTLSHADLF